MRYSQTGTISRSKTPTNRSVIEPAKRVRVEVSSPSPSKNMYRLPDKSPSPVRNISRTISNIDPQREYVEKVREEKELRLKLKTLLLENDSLAKMQEKYLKEMELKQQKYEEEKTQIIELFTEFVVQKNVLVEFPKTISIRNIGRIHSENNSKAREKSEPRISSSLNIVTMARTEAETNQSSNDDSRAIEDSKYFVKYLLKDLYNSQLPSNVRAMYHYHNISQ
jgi:hypothetical protein